MYKVRLRVEVMDLVVMVKVRVRGYGIHYALLVSSQR